MTTEKIAELLKSLTYDYWYDVQMTSGIKDSNNVLCTALVKFFSEYEAELRINIAHEQGNRTLRRSLQELDSFVASYYPF